jgi:hypothetical protein
MGCCQSVIDHELTIEAPPPEEEFKDLSLSSSPRNQRRATSTLQTILNLETSFALLSPPYATVMGHRPTRSLGEFSTHLVKVSRLSLGSDPTMDDMHISEEGQHYCLPASVIELEFSESESSISVVSVLEISDF